ncbi:MAG: hypothetical protein EZS28_033401, partial [Streblomastix strix]
MVSNEAHVTDVIQIHDETLFGNRRYNKVGLVEQIEDDALLLLKANVADIANSYSKTEDDALVLLKANITYLTNYVDLAFAQIITGQKQFDVICASSISKLSKNHVSIILAGGGDMLVSTLVAKPQLQEIRDNPTEKSKAYVFSIQGELNEWIVVQDNVAKLIIGDILYIVSKEVADYCWDGTDLKVLKTELFDTYDVMTTLGAVIGGGNVLIDRQIDGNTIISAKNTMFVTTEFDQIINGSKIFTCSIHSVGILVQMYDKSNVICADGGV